MVKKGQEIMTLGSPDEEVTEMPPRLKEIMAGMPKEERSAIDELLANPNLTVSDKRRVVLERLGMKKTKQKYGSPEERKVAAKERALQRKQEKSSVMEFFGLGKQEIKPKKTKEEKSAARSKKRKSKKNFMEEMALKFPEAAKKSGLDVEAIKKRVAQRLAREKDKS